MPLNIPVCIKQAPAEGTSHVMKVSQAGEIVR